MGYSSPRSADVPVRSGRDRRPAAGEDTRAPMAIRQIENLRYDESWPAPPAVAANSDIASFAFLAS